MRATAPLGAHLDDALVTPGSFQHGPAFIDSFCEGLFDINIFAGLAGVNGRQRVPMVGCGDEDTIDVFAIEHTAEVLDGIGSMAALLFDIGDGPDQHLVIDVADDRAINLLVLQEDAQDIAATTATTDNAD